MRPAIDQLPGSLIREVTNAGLGRSDVLPFWFGESDEVTPEPIRNAAAESLARGKDRYEIHCAICHGQSGRGGNGDQGHGLVGRRWPVAVPNFHAVQGKDNRVANFTDGEYFEVLSSPVGRNTMPSYAARITVEDRWAIVQYIRALQTLGNQ